MNESTITMLTFVGMCGFLLIIPIMLFIAQRPMPPEKEEEDSE